jgi:hypothetical protein
MNGLDRAANQSGRREGDLVARVEAATSCRELLKFRCGPGTLFPKAEDEVHKILSIACDPSDPRRKEMTLQVAREEPCRAIVGVVGIERGPLQIQHTKYTPHAYKDAAYIAVLALSEHYRTDDPNDPWETKDGERLGDALMHAALRHIKKGARGGCHGSRPSSIRRTGQAVACSSATTSSSI